MPGSRTRTTMLVVTAVAVASLAAPAQAAPPVPTPPSQPGTALPLAGGAGAAVPFTEYQAENARTNGTILGPDRGYTRLAAEASGRRAVALDAGEYVEFVLAKAANAVDIRYSIEDGPDAALAVAVDGRTGPRLTLTAKYAG